MPSPLPQHGYTDIDLDQIYMSFTTALTGGGGWPMSVWIDPTSLKPFLAGTYYPPVTGPAPPLPGFGPGGGGAGGLGFGLGGCGLPFLPLPSRSRF